MKTQRDTSLSTRLRSAAYEEQLEAIFQAIPDLLFHMDSTGTILDYRAGNASNLYLPPQEFLGKRMQDVMPPEVAEKFISALEKIKSINEVVSYEYDLKISGRKASFEARLVKLPGSDVMAIVRDITIQKHTSEKLQHQLQQMEALRSIDSAIASSYDLTLTLFVILTQVASQLKVDAADILLANHGNRTLDYAAGRGFKTEMAQHTHLSLGMGFAGQVAQQKCLVHVPDISESDPGLIHPAIMRDEKFILYIGVPLISKGLVKGVLEIFNRTPLAPDEEWFTLLNALAGQAAIAIDNASILLELQQTNRQLALAYDATIEGWAKALELRDRLTEGHAQRVTEMTIKFARLLGMDEKQIVHIRRGAYLHDIGKMGIPDSILQKKGPLSSKEMQIMHKHPLYAKKMLSPIPFLKPVLDIPVYHHEKWDGTGYPYGLRGEQIPLPARIFAIVDVFDALTSDRPYQRAWDHKEAVSYILQQSGTYFDPDLVPMAVKEFRSTYDVEK